VQATHDLRSSSAKQPAQQSQRRSVRAELTRCPAPDCRCRQPRWPAAAGTVQPGDALTGACLPPMQQQQPHLSSWVGGEVVHVYEPVVQLRLHTHTHTHAHRLAVHQTATACSPGNALVSDGCPGGFGFLQPRPPSPAAEAQSQRPAAPRT
jgi:hypothetical protein